MIRTNIFQVKFKNEKGAFSLAENCARLWNALNYKRRQTFFKGDFDWDFKRQYELFRHSVGSITAREIIRKNDQAWRTFFRLLYLQKAGKLPSYIRKISPPGYWKDTSGHLKLRIIIRNDCYKIVGRRIKLPFRLAAKIYGKPRYIDRQGALEICYDRTSGKWYAHQAVETRPTLLPSGNKRAYIDVGVKCIICGYIEGEDRAIVYRGSKLLSDWWYWNKRIMEHQRELKTVNKKNTSRKLKRLYRIRKLRFKHAINRIVKDFMWRCYRAGVSEVIIGDLKGIRNRVESHGRKGNAMVHNFWNHSYITDRLRWTAENLGIKANLVDEGGTSSRCPWCGHTRFARRGRLYKCLSCGVEAHRDVVGALNISLVHGGSYLPEGGINRVMAHPVAISLR